MSAILIDRRLAIGGLLGLGAFKGAAANEAIPAEITAAIREKVGAAEASEGGITLKVPDTAENGAFVSATRNPTPGVASYQLGAGLARAEVSARIRLAEGQVLLAYARMADGSVRRAAARVAVSTGGCLT